jgi:hypothetical protein
MDERWKPVAGYEDCYSISNLGRLARTAGYGEAKTPCFKLRESALKGGYRSYHMCKDGIRKYRYAHIMVWEAFNGQIPEGLEIDHKDNDRANARLANLQLATRSQNVTYAFRRNNKPPANNPSPGSRNGCAKLTEADIPTIFALSRTGKFQYEIAEMFGVSQPAIGRILRGVGWKHVAETPAE